jgi:CRISPR/Cas system CSM-associated protein Csm3 (group 7 of RAMP superfamily)
MIPQLQGAAQGAFDTRAFWHPGRSRHIVRRIVVEGVLTLESPAHLGDGDGSVTDMALLRDPVSQMPLLTGTTLAGALRAYLARTWLKHDAGKKIDGDLFGSSKVDAQDEARSQDTAQSALIVDDAYGRANGTELREGVRLDAPTRTAANDALFDFEVWRNGLAFDIRFELLVSEANRLGAARSSEHELREALSTALDGLSRGAITLGARKRRGYGQVRAGEWRVRTYDVQTHNGALAWLTADLDADTRAAYGGPVIEAHPGLDALAPPQPVQEDRLEFRIDLALDSALLIRGTHGPGDLDTDAVHLHGFVPRDGGHELQPIVGGPSWAGALRGRALRIAQTMATDKNLAEQMVDDMFGAMAKDKKQGSRVTTYESVLTGASMDHIQNRVSIDRLSCGAYDTALFNERPAWPGVEPRLTCRVTLATPEAAHAGLLLLTLKDLMLSDLPLGGTIGMGRGKTHCIGGMLTRYENNAITEWTVTRAGDDIAINGGGRDTLNRYVTAALRALGRAQPAHPAQ